MITIIGGDCTRSWLSLPLAHSTKVKGGKKHFWGTPIHGNPLYGCMYPLLNQSSIYLDGWPTNFALPAAKTVISFMVFFSRLKNVVWDVNGSELQENHLEIRKSPTQMCKSGMVCSSKFKVPCFFARWILWDNTKGLMISRAQKHQKGPPTMCTS